MIDKVQKGRTKITYRTSSRKEENTHSKENKTAVIKIENNYYGKVPSWFLR